VLLIIGILIAGVTQSSRLVAQIRLSSARQQTQRSPVSSITNLVLWMETTSEKSFDDAATEDGTAISSGSNYNWYDINTQNPRRYTANSATGPTYKINCINNLPCLSFNGSTQSLTFPAMGSSSQISMFVVYNNVGPTLATQYIISSINAFVPNIGFSTSTTGGLTYYYNLGSGYGNVGALKTNTPSILEVIDRGTSSTLYYSVPGAAMGQVASGSTSGARNFTGGATVGAFSDGSTTTGYFNGYIAEIIIFDRALKQEEKSAIDAYLTKKWGIRTS